MIKDQLFHSLSGSVGKTVVLRFQNKNPGSFVSDVFPVFHNKADPLVISVLWDPGHPQISVIQHRVLALSKKLRISHSKSVSGAPFCFTVSVQKKQSDLLFRTL